MFAHMFRGLEERYGRELAAIRGQVRDRGGSLAGARSRRFAGGRGFAAVRGQARGDPEPLVEASGVRKRPFSIYVYIYTACVNKKMC